MSACQVVANKMQHAVHNKPDSVQLKIADDGSSQKALPQQTLAELSNVQKELKQHVVSNALSPNACTPCDEGRWPATGICFGTFAPHSLSYVNVLQCSYSITAG